MPFGGWELGATVRVLSGHTDVIWSVVPVDSAGAGVVLWTTSSDRTIRRWDPVAGTQIGASIPYPEGFPGRLVPFTDRTGKRLLLHVAAKDADDGFGTAVPVVRYFDPTTATELRPPLSVRPGPSGHTICQVNLPDGRVTIATRHDPGVQLWDLDSGAPVGPKLTFPGQFEIATSMRTLDSGGNTVLVVCRSRGHIGRYDVASIVAGTWTGTQTKLTGLSPVDAVAVPLPDGRTGLAVGGEWRRPDQDPDTRENRLHLLDAATLQPIGSHVIVPASIETVACLPLRDGGNVIAVSDDERGAIRMYDPVTLQQIGPPLESVNFTSWVLTPFPLPDGRLALATAGFRDDIRIWAPHVPPPASVSLTGHDGAVHGLAAVRLPDGRVIVASAGSDRTVRRWDAGAAAQLGSPLTGHTGQVFALAAVPLPGGPGWVSASADLSLRRWDAATGAALGSPLTGHTGVVRSVAVAALGDGRVLILSVSSDGTLRRWDAATGAPVGSPLTGHTGAVLAVTTCTLADGRVLAATGGDDGTVRRWDAATGNAVGGALTGATGAVRSIAPYVGPDGRVLLAAGGDDAAVRLWDATTGAPVGSPLTGHTGVVRALTALPRSDGPPMLASGSDDESVRLWNPLTGGAARPPLTAHTEAVRAVAAAPALPDGRMLLATAGSDATIRLWTIA
ncbi:MAG TPA: WD40 repeat domain-containing protein [Blastococcus sp.]|nr:WD40 repeat domain-containing protein [Blastococcus sp.]